MPRSIASVFRFFVYALGIVAVPVLTALVVAPLAPPLRAFSTWLGANYGAAGPILALIALFAGGLAFSRWAAKRDERREIIRSGVIEQRPTLFGPDGKGRILATLLTPLALLTVVLVVLWLSGGAVMAPR